MKVVKTIEDARRAVREARAAGKRIGLVPTMGALHAGHLSLIDAAAADCDFVAVSIFVNPTQFGAGEDLAAYPRTPEADLAACRARGVELVFMPAAEAMYPDGELTTVSVRDLCRSLCGRSRPGHFDGVCTIVAKLFNIIQPQAAYFGAKDFQQAVVIRRMAADLNFPVEIVVCPTVREPDGLAMSSRNAYLSPAHRSQAVALYESLQLGAKMIRRSRPPAPQVVAAVREHIAAHAPDGEIDYIQIVDPETLKDVETPEGAALIALAVKFGDARLIDNMLVDADALRA
ncbi:MAG: pantoate--beta-alanine ligase [Planctomycetota bacterium]|nr:pantoate--beta-alanine ligase [Planctomycetota bacterium]